MAKKGGKGKKKSKKKGNNDQIMTKLIYKEEDQYYAVITKMLGDGRVMLKYINSDNRLVESMGIIRGKMRKRVWINVGNFVLVTDREFEKGKVDIVHKYSDRNVHSLKRDGEIGGVLLDCSDTYSESCDKSADMSIDFILNETEYEKEYTTDEKTKETKETVNTTLNSIETMNSINDSEFNWDEI